MHQSIAELEKLLAEQKSLYCELYRLEEEKTGAIISKNGSLIQELCVSQENLLGQVESAEAGRSALISLISDCLGEPEASCTISRIAEYAGESGSRRLMATGAEFKSVILRLKERQETNSRLLKDNLEFFSIFIAGLKNSSSLKGGYDRDGKENVRVVNPVLFNTKA